MTRKFLFFFAFLFFNNILLAQNGIAPAMPIVHYFPQLAAGRLASSEWNTEVKVFNSSGSPNAILVELFDSNGNPLAMATSRGISDKFSIVVIGPGPETVEIYRDNGFTTGWVKTTAYSPHNGIVKFQQFQIGGQNPIGQTNVFSSPVQNVLTFPLDPENGIALVNPGSQDANVAFTAFDVLGQKLREGSFIFARGKHFSSFFSQEPFFLMREIGTIVIASNIPLSGMLFDFDGSVFSTLPSLSTPRRLDSPRSDIKIGFFYINSDDRQPMKKEEIQARLVEAVEMQKFLLDKEMPLNGFRKVDLPYDIDENGLPKVVMVQGGNRDTYFDYTKNDGNRTRSNVIMNEFKGLAPSNWKYQIYLVDFWGADGDIGQSGGGGFFQGATFISALKIPFMKVSLFGNKTLARDAVISEFGGRTLDPFTMGQTLEDLADAAFSIFNHENGHAFWGLMHSDAGSNNSKFRSMVGRIAQNGCFNPEKAVECIMLPVEAHGVSIGTLSRLNDFGWISDEPSWPIVEVLSKELVGVKLRVIFRVEDQKNGVGSIAIQTPLGTGPWTRYWRTVGHLDDLNQMTIEADVSGTTNNIFLYVVNNQGNSLQVSLF